MSHGGMPVKVLAKPPGEVSLALAGRLANGDPTPEEAKIEGRRQLPLREIIQEGATEGLGRDRRPGVCDEVHRHLASQRAAHGQERPCREEAPGPEEGKAVEDSDSLGP